MTAPLKLLKAVVAVGLTESREIYDVDAIEYAGHFWLVPEWLPGQPEGFAKPARIIRIDQPYTRSGDGIVTVSTPVPMPVFFGLIPSIEASPYVVLVEPDIRVVMLH